MTSDTHTHSMATVPKRTGQADAGRRHLDTVHLPVERPERNGQHDARSLAHRTVCGHEPAEDQERQPGGDERRTPSDRQPHEAAGKPGHREHEEDPSPIRLATQPGQEGQRDYREEVLRCDDDVPDPVEQWSEPGAHQVGMEPDRDHRPSTPRRPAHRATYHPDNAPHVNHAPARAMTAPVKRRADFPHSHRWINPSPIPLACNVPVEATNPIE